MKKLLTIVSLLAAISLQAREGFYIGAEAGAGFLTRVPKKSALRNRDLPSNIADVKAERIRFTGGAHVGYTFDLDEQISIAPQIGYRYVQRARFKSGEKATSASANDALTYFDGSHQLNVVDFLAVGTYRINPTWDVQAKIGAALVMDKVRVKSLNELANSAVPTTKALYFDKSKTKKSVRPEVGIGVGYLVNENLRLSLDATHIFGSHSRIVELAGDQTTSANRALMKSSQEASYVSFRKVPSLTTVSLALQYLF